MNYQVLARKWRPKTFSDVVGQDHVLIALKNSLEIKNIHHAYLFSGIRGVGKTSIARLLAKGLNCEIGITATPCGVCKNCYEIEKGRFIDLIEVDAASKTKVEDIKDLLDSMQYSPSRGRFKIYLIDEVHMLSRHSFNALLKTLEEPPLHIKCLLATTDSQKLPITILSRCLRFHLKSLDNEKIYQHLKRIMDEEKILYESSALQLLARTADGSLRDALNLTDQAIATSNDKKLSEETVRDMFGIVGSNQALLLINAIVAADGKKVLKLVDESANFGIEWESLLIEMQILLHNIAMIQFFSQVKDEKVMNAEPRIYELAHSVSPTDIQLYYQILLIGRKELPFAPNKRIGIEMTLLRALAFHPKKPLSESKEIPIPLIEDSVSATTFLQESIFPQSSDCNTSQILNARSQLQRTKEIILLEKEKFKNIDKTTQLVNSKSEETKFLIFKKKINLQQDYKNISLLDKRKESSYEEKSTFLKKNIRRNHSTSDSKIEYEKKSDLITKISDEVLQQDAWALEISKLHLPKFVELMALNSWKEQQGNRVFLHLRSEKYHFNLKIVQKKIEEALSTFQGIPIKLTIIKDDNTSIKTPMEKQHAIYKKKLAKERKAFITDNRIKTLKYFFNAELDEESIHLI